MSETDERAVWSTAFINNLPDSSFLYIEPGGQKDSEGKTTPRSLRHFPVKDANGNVDRPHLANALSRIPQSSLPDSVKAAAAAKAQRMMAALNNTASAAPPKDDLFRGVFPGDFELREQSDSLPTLEGHFSVFNDWTEINSTFEGNFLERFAPGAFAKTIEENRSHMRVLFQHGRDPQIGDKVLGQIDTLEEDKQGARYSVPLFDTSYNRDLIPGLRAGVYGASMRFRAIREDFKSSPEPSDYNPKGLPERTITEARVMEFGPVTFPAYANATAGVRSLTDDFRPPVVVRDDTPITTEDLPGHDDEPEAEGTIVDTPEAIDDVPSDADGQNDAEDKAAPSHPTDESRRDTQPAQTPTTERETSMENVDEMRARVDTIKQEMKDIAAENAGQVLEPDTQARWDALKVERDELVTSINADEERQAYIREVLDKQPTAERAGHDTGTYISRRRGPDQAPENIFDLQAYVGQAGSTDQLRRVYRDGAQRAIEGFYYPHPNVDRAEASAHLERLLNSDGVEAEIAQRIIAFGAPVYRAAFWKSLTKQPLTTEEQRAMMAGMMIEARAGITTGQTGGVTVPIQIDPTVLPTSNGALNPFRTVSRIVQTTSHKWQAVTSPGITATYRAEGSVMTDNTPTLNSPAITPHRADAFVPFSWEAAQDWGGLESALGEALSDAKDTLEATKFAVGAGDASNEPQGVLVGAGTVVGTSGATAFAVADVYGLEAQLPPRYQPNAVWLATSAIYQRVRQFDTAGGANLWVTLGAGNPDRLLGYPAYKASTVGTAGNTLATTVRWGILGDFSRYAIVDRIGLQIRTIDNLFSGNTTGGITYPMGMSGIVAYWRNSAGVLDSNAFRVGTIT